MTTLRTLSVALLFASTAVAVSAQTQTQPMPMMGASAPMPSASMPQDCPKQVPLHDHGADKGMPMPKKAMSGPCAPDATASAPKAKATHEHTPIQRNR